MILRILNSTLGAALVFVFAAGPVFGATFTDRALFKASLSGVVEHASPFTDFTVTAAPGSSLNNNYATYTDKFGPNPYVVLNGVENFDVTIAFAGPLIAFGMDVYEPNNSTATFNGCNATCIDSTFEMKLFIGAVLLETVVFNPINDVLSFIGVTNGTGFDSLQIRETVGGIDNEMFGNFISAPVPLPAGLPLMLTALGVLALFRRRR